MKIYDYALHLKLPNIKNNKGSIIITTNLSFDKWKNAFNDSTLTCALLDRIIHKAHVIDMSGESYRF